MWFLILVVAAFGIPAYKMRAEPVPLTDFGKRLEADSLARADTTVAKPTL